VAGRQKGLVTRAQLLELGLSRYAIDSRVRSGRLHSLHRGVYSLTHPHRAQGARELAAVLACGPGATLSHCSAAAWWRLLKPRPGPCDIIVPGRVVSSRQGIRVHCVTSLHLRDIRTHRGVRVTAPAGTLLDIASAVSLHELEQALAEATARSLLRPAELRELLDRSGQRRGLASLRALLDPSSDATKLTRSEAERRMLTLIRRAALPTPDVNVKVGDHEVDFVWRDQGVVVEVDGFRYHSSRAAFERDRLRDADLAARGLRVIRVTWRQLVDTPEAVVARIAAALAVRPG
jgi:very-short-patch-repair endonuclease